MSRMATLGMLTAGLFAATATIALAQQGSGTPSRSDNESSAMGNCFDRNAGITRNAVNPRPASDSAGSSTGTTGASGAGGSPPSEPSASFATNNIGQSRSGDPGKAGNDATAKSSGLPDC